MKFGEKSDQSPRGPETYLSYFENLSFNRPMMCSDLGQSVSNRNCTFRSPAPKTPIFPCFLRQIQSEQRFDSSPVLFR
jgi:hypothetical protein